MRHVPALALALLVAPVLTPAQGIYPTSPDWTSADSHVATGAALVDLDRDGWLDLVVANGNDMEQEPLVVFYNQGGTFPTTPQWSSLDSAYNGHLDVADVDGDGWLDVAVAELGSYDTYDHSAKLYLNNAGTLSTLPDWESAELGNAFGCAFGDVNNDGRPDLAVATGWAYDPQNSFPNYVYVNSGGALPASATWSSADVTHLQGVLWADANRDGWLDLVGIASHANTLVYANTGGVLSTTPTWQTTDIPGADAIMGASGDVTGDGYPDLFVADNNQLSGGSGRVRQYTGLAGGYFQTTMSWSYFDGYVSAAALADVDNDGDLDLATGAWWDKARLFLNTGTGLPTSPTWSSTPSTVVEKIVFGDVDRNGLGTARESFPAGGRLYWLPYRPIQHVVEVSVDGVPLTAAQYTVGRDSGWVTVGVEPTSGVEVLYHRSTGLDMVVSNWDAVGNHLYLNRLSPWLLADGFESGDTSGWSSVEP